MSLVLGWMVGVVDVLQFVPQAGRTIRRRRDAAALGGLIALALVPIAPPGVPVLAATAAALVGLRHHRRIGGDDGLREHEVGYLLEHGLTDQ